MSLLPGAGFLGEVEVEGFEAAADIDGAADDHGRCWQRKASKKQAKTKPETREYAKYVIVFTTQAIATADEILEWYRLHWQIELVFKRFKTIAQLGHLPKQAERSARAWLHGKLLVALLTQKLIRVGRAIFPWGYNLQPAPQPVA